MNHLRADILPPAAGIREVLEQRWPGLCAHLDRATQQAGPAWFVGGFLRDWVLGSQSNDIDIACVNPKDWAAALAIHGRNVLMDAQRGHFRVVAPGFPHSGVDVIPLKGVDIEADLLARDFTVNALALSWPDHQWIDVLGAAEDLQRRTLKLVGATTLDDDPLRALRAHRLGAQLQLSMDPSVRDQCTPFLSHNGPAHERIRQEWMALLAADHGPAWLSDHSELVAVIVTDPDRFAAGWRAATQAIGMATDRGVPILEEIWTVVERRSRRAATIQAALLGGLQLHSGVAIREFLRLQRPARTETRITSWTLDALEAAVALGEDPLRRAEFLNFAREGAFPALIGAFGTDGGFADLITELRELGLRATTSGPIEPGAVFPQPRPLVTGKTLLDAGVEAGATLQGVLQSTFERQWAGYFHTVEDALGYALAQLDGS